MTTTTPTAELTSDQAVNLARSLGRKITLTTWRGYVHRGEAPGPARHVGRTPLWDEAEIRDWAADPAAWRTRTQQGAVQAAVRDALAEIRQQCEVTEQGYLSIVNDGYNPRETVIEYGAKLDGLREALRIIREAEAKAATQSATTPKDQP